MDTSSSELRSKALVKHLSGKPSFQTAGLNKKSLVRNGVRPQDSSSSASASQLWVKEPNWTPNNNWVVTYGQLTNDSTYNQAAIDMIVGGVGSPSDFGGVLGTLDSFGLNGNLSPGNNAEQGAVFTLQDENSRTNLLGYLANWRFENFYFFGHGNESTIGSYNGFTLTKDQIAFALGNVPLSYQMEHAADHPYRFVWIDACDTGAGSFCEAFGIPALTVSTNFFAAAGVESRAFL